MSGEGDPAAPIGVFDSGVGGLTVAAALARRLPDESIVYLGDTARLPYGSKSPETVGQYTRKNIDFLVAQGVKAIVVACNTASALALPRLTPPVPTWGVIGPGARRAAAATSGRVGVIATESTVRSDAYGEALRALLPGVRVESRACPLFVPLVEEGWHDDAVTEEVARRYLAPLLAAGVDTLVLGCTHYPLLRDVLARVAGDGVTLVDSAEAVADEVARGLAAEGLAAPPGSAAAHRLYLTDVSEGFERLARRILGDQAADISWVEVV
ncbi:MAG TPA: glutamate racemase [Thermoanaerobaculia bacterium]|nr:glutamate racemase [Thermoanaerobaculia bacterium]